MSNATLNSPERQAQIKEQFAEADAISRLEGYDPDAFEEAQKQRIVTGEISTEEFIAVMAKHILSE